MNSLKELKESVSSIQYLLQKNPIKDEEFNKVIINMKNEIIKQTLTFLILEKKNHVLDKININENIQKLYTNNKEPMSIDLEYDKKYKIEAKINELNKLIEIIKDL
jgi:hypothetical protein